MPISVVVRDERHRDLARLEDVLVTLPTPPVTVTADLLPLGRSADFPLLAHVDPHGSTCFNRAQSAAVAAELDAWHRAAPSERSRALLAGITVLVTGHMARPHRYLWFIGD